MSCSFTVDVSSVGSGLRSEIFGGMSSIFESLLSISYPFVLSSSGWLCPRPSLVKAKTRRCRASHVTSATFSLVHKKMFQRNSTSTFSLLVERRRHSFLAPIEISSVIMRAHRAVRAAVSSEIAASLSGRSCASRPRFLCLNAPAARRKETRCFSQGRVLRAGAAEAV